MQAWFAAGNVKSEEAALGERVDQDPKVVSRMKLGVPHAGELIVLAREVRIETMQTRVHAFQPNIYNSPFAQRSRGV
jgi:hypothetical protein